MNDMTLPSLNPTRLQKFLANEASPGIVLVLAAIAALLMANSPFLAGYQSFLETPVSIQIGALSLDKPLVLWINDGLMALFFFVVGLEIKRELFYGHLADKKQLALPFVGAIAGIAVPAVIYILITQGDTVATNGWAIPSATDIAFALGLFILLGKHLPVTLKLFLLSVAIIDDIAAVIIIALFYSQDLSTLSLALASIGLVALFVLNRLKVQQKAFYILIGLFVWTAVLKSGVHATLAGFAIAWFIPLKKEKSESLAHQIEHALHPWIAFFVLPLFAFANAGVTLLGTPVEQLITPITIGIAVGLFIGKQVGIFGFCWLAVKSGLCSLPKDVRWIQLYAASVLCGIGFTMSLFIGSLAFETQGLAYQSQVKVGVLAGSLLSALLGALLLVKSSASIRHQTEEKNHEHQNAYQH